MQSTVDAQIGKVNHEIWISEFACIRLQAGCELGHPRLAIVGDLICILSQAIANTALKRQPAYSQRRDDYFWTVWVFFNFLFATEEHMLSNFALVAAWWM